MPPMKKYVLLLLTLSSTALGKRTLCGLRGKAAGDGGRRSPMHGDDALPHEDAQRDAAKADPSTWFSLFQWLAAFDGVRDRRCPS